MLLYHLNVERFFSPHIKGSTDWVAFFSTEKWPAFTQLCQHSSSHSIPLLENPSSTLSHSLTHLATRPIPPSKAPFIFSSSIRPLPLFTLPSSRQPASQSLQEIP